MQGPCSGQTANGPINDKDSGVGYALMQKATLTAASVAPHFEIECLLLLSRLMLPYYRAQQAWVIPL